MSSVRIEFESPAKRLDGERRSKLLKKGSKLYEYLTMLRDRLDSEIDYEHRPDRPLHIEVINSEEAASDDLLDVRTRFLDGCVIALNALTWMNGALVIPYLDVHVTVHYYGRVLETRKEEIIQTAKRIMESILLENHST